MLANDRPDRLPEWFRVTLPSGDDMERYRSTTASVKDNQLHTVCEEAHCPNIHDCWSRGTATFMIAGKACTRGCRFCAVDTVRNPPPPDLDEPGNLADAIESMGLTYAVITVVNRDDMEDGGASHYRQCLDAVHQRLPEVGLELLCSDLSGNLEALESLLDNAPLQVFAHNVETVRRLTPRVRDPRATFEQSILILKKAKELRPDIMTKSSIMLGLGETEEDIIETFSELRNAKVDLLTLGQYLAPGPGYLPVVSFPKPERFDKLANIAKEMGFRAIASGPMVRSSYRAESLVAAANGKTFDSELKVVA
ncbi:MAG TPA: lipoyl synthase [Marine Group III euryarchaeote]|nr:lipoyl synthase [Candidatus Poseidoniia archaeon]HIC61932.1 lipoyl synthase [Marine Group III euryarchaeote]